ncbi:Phosphatidylinositol transfer protein [Histomonas meleagridis]|uniref:Phosphatidylinositol transfer protein n=1 Tax=Histomonas meleagridis TaxID=135588 RepID=UPI00355A8BEA|nr:Phosphatidylinositol transfer protein [Histomonas meleagridis]KAH0797184.1 Phosphatidylinositol transfer protein [Histomonas meleagridis]
MQILEFRIVVPVDYYKYAIGNRYMNFLYLEAEKQLDEGIEILKNEPYNKNGEKGQYTEKVYDIKSKLPLQISLFVPNKYLHFHEKSYNAYPHFYTEYSVPGLKDKFKLSIESQHLEFSRGMKAPDNLLNLDKKELKNRKVIYLDVFNEPIELDSPEDNIQNFVCPEANINTPIDTKGKPNPKKIPKWVKNYDGPMTLCVKVVRFEIKWPAAQKVIDKFVSKVAYFKIFTNANRKVIASMKQWYKMTIEDILEIEDKAIKEQRQKGESAKDEEESSSSSSEGKIDKVIKVGGKVAKKIKSLKK